MERNISVIMAVRGLNLASKYTNRIVIMKDGTVFDMETPENDLASENIRSVYGWWQR